MASVRTHREKSLLQSRSLADIREQVGGRSGRRSKDEVMTSQQCWFCGMGIEPDDLYAVRIAVSALWHTDGGRQAIFAHSICARRRLDGKSMEFDPEVLS